MLTADCVHRVSASIVSRLYALRCSMTLPNGQFAPIDVLLDSNFSALVPSDLDNGSPGLRHLSYHDLNPQG